MSTLKNTIESLAADFAAAVLASLRGMSLEEILQASGKTNGVPARRGPGRPPKARTAPAAAPPAPAAPKASGKLLSGKLQRRSPEAMAKTETAIVALLHKNPKGMRAEQIQAALGLHRKETPRPIAHLLEQKKISKKGEKRSTTYFAK